MLIALMILCCDPLAIAMTAAASHNLRAGSMRAQVCCRRRGTVKNRNIKALPIEDHGDTDAIFIDDVAAIMERGTVTHVILASVQARADSELPTAMYRRVMVRLIIPTDRRDEIGKQVAAGPVALGWR
jgi:hypothetical protein